MASNKEMREKYVMPYDKLCDIVAKRQGRVSDAEYAFAVGIANEFRDWAILGSGMTNLPEVPTENK